MFGTLARFFDRLDAFLSLWGRLLSWLSTAGAGALSYWGATATELFRAWAPFSYIMAGLAGAALFAFILACVGWFRLGLAKGRLLNQLSRPTLPVNPLDDSFDKKRIKLSEFVDPTLPIIKGKTFVKCELVGPVNLIFSGNDMGVFQTIGCDLVELSTPKKTEAKNAILVADCIFRDCIFMKATLFFNQSSAEHIRKMHPNSYWMARSNIEEQDVSR